MLITTGWLTTMRWWSQRWLRQQSAWQWWHQQRTLQLHGTAESIRNDLLQQTFAFRRYLENTAAERSTTADDMHPQHAIRRKHEPSEQWLEKLQTLHQTLENLSNELSPPFLSDNLPLALNFMVHYRRYTISTLSIDLKLPTDWPFDLSQQGSPIKNQLVLSVLTELLTLLLDHRETAQHLRITLHREATTRLLSVDVEDSDTDALQCIAQKPEVRHLQEIFYSLAGGQLALGVEGAALTSCLRWNDT